MFYPTLVKRSSQHNNQGNEDEGESAQQYVESTPI